MAKVECDVCGRHFDDEEALKMHKNAKHSEPEKKSKGFNIPKKKVKVTLIWVVVIGLVVWGVASIISGLGQYDEFAQCLSETNTTMYGNDNCQFCQQQKNRFGTSWEYMESNYVRCSGPGSTPDQQRQCQEVGVQSTPTWEFPDGSTQAGVIEIEQMAEKVEGCNIEE